MQLLVHFINGKEMLIHWDEPFNPEEELSKNNCEDIIDYYAGWEDVLDMLGVDDENLVYDIVKKNSKKINKKEFK